jgi:2-oxoglutarate ferredoxin oxidoreductase subunit delta
METRHYQIEIARDRCKGCAFCVEFCPQHVLVKSNEINKKGYTIAKAVNPEDCRNCGMCVLLCPDFAIKVTAAEGGGNERA